ncbi:ferric reductase like transmembrane component-domain-containing protein [Glomus cerebriforme]|uniref:Ferric reductase like transmembrane component-domain-containing protein n=1 Tax=Glomus cerebriforme TaxID=658196 RepID=A0A397SFM1_9GLOM|nr:ferric reductase like transmembrane component-domain-containing protein [Glomus cerebriforme]
MLGSQDFAAGYYQVLTYTGIIIILSIIYQFNQISKYITRTKWPQIPDLPSRREGKKNEGEQSTTTYLPDTTKIHAEPTVMFHKFTNYTLHVFSVGDMTVGEILLFVLFIVINLIFLLSPFPADASGGETFSKRCAYLALANAAFVFPLATRNSIFLKLIGVPFERLIRFHRWVGRTIFFLITFHGSFQIQQSYEGSESVSQALVGTPTNQWGFLAYISLIIIMFTSHSVIRRYAFEVFYWSHFSFIFFIIFGNLHQPEFIQFTAIGMGLYIIDRLARFIFGLGTINVIGIEAIQSGVTKIIFEFKDYYESGQYMFINLANLNPPVSLLAWHPISFSSSPSVMDDGVHYASIHMKVQGGFSRNLYARSHEGLQYNQVPLKMRVDGPYGKTSLDFMQHNTVVLVSGGIGITPMISILRDLVDRQVANMPIVTQSIYFLWVIPDTDAYQWFGSELRELMSRAGTLPQNKYILDVKVFLTRSTTTPSSIFFQGRPDFSIFFHDIKRFHGSGDIAVGVCGPAVMLKQVRNAAVQSSDETCLFKVHSETFEL